ncbi:MAG: transposase [Candidatus Sericytochromatia bacterium]|nr:transposase [Candidatus Sericytochromatia bacterium]
MKRRKHSAETKTKAVLEAIKEEQTLAEVASKYDVHPKLLAQWKQEFVENANLVFNRKRQEKQLQEDLKEKDKTIDSLYKEVGQLTLKVNWAEKKIREFGL